MIQDDWICQGPPQYLRHAIAVMEQNPNVGIINFASTKHPFAMDLPLHGSPEPCYVTPKPLEERKTEQFLHSDQPHLRSPKVEEVIGYYLEDRDMERCEQDYSDRWKHLRHFLTAAFPTYHGHVFTNSVGPEEGFRITRLRYRVAAVLQPYKRFIPKPLISIARNCVLWPIYLMERLGLTR